jgi:hypothetical protein
MLLLMLPLLLIGGAAPAATLNLDNCDAFGCQGSSVFLTVEDAGGGNWDVTLGLDSTGYTGTKTGVVQAGFKAISGFDDVTLDSFSDGAWAPAKGAGINSSGLCAGGSSSQFVCTSGYANILTDDVYTWNFTVEGGSVLDEWTIKFQYGNATGVNNGQLISAPGRPGPPIPEPTAALVFAAGLLVARPYLRRRR